MAPSTAKRYNSTNLKPKLITDHNISSDLDMVDEEESKGEGEFLQRPVQLVRINHDEGKFELCQEGLQILRGIKGYVGIVAFSGLYRTGKSFTLNLLIDKGQEGFTVDSRVKSCTQGLWIWGSPIFVEERNMYLVFIDTEGSGSVDRSTTYDAKLFALVVLLSSYLVYNSMGVIDENAITNLSLAAQLTKNIAMNISGGMDKQEIIASLTPKFMWILKDFTLEIKDEYGKDISSNEYLENCLLTKSLRGRNTEINTKVRETILKLFRQRECMVFIRPVDGEEELQFLNTVPFSNYRPKFKEQFLKFKDKIFHETQMKMIHGRPCTGNILGNLLEEYIGSINRGAIPNISGAWDTVIEHEIEDGFRKGKDLYLLQTKKLVKVEPVEEKELCEKLYEAKKIALQLINKNIRLIEENNEPMMNTLRKYEFRMNQLASDNQKKIFDINHKLSQKYCTEIFEREFGELERKSVNNEYQGENMSKIHIDMNKCISAFNEHAKGPGKLDIITNLLPVQLNSIHRSLAHNFKKETADMVLKHKQEIAQTKEKNSLYEIENARLMETNNIKESRLNLQKGQIEDLDKEKDELAEKIQNMEKEKKQLRLEQIQLERKPKPPPEKVKKGACGC